MVEWVSALTVQLCLLRDPIQVRSIVCSITFCLLRIFYVMRHIPVIEVQCFYHERRLATF